MKKKVNSHIVTQVASFGQQSRIHISNHKTESVESQYVRLQHTLGEQRFSRFAGTAQSVRSSG
jgi:hypothetical protein